MTIILGLALTAALGVSAWKSVENYRLENKLESCKLDNKVLQADVAIHHAKVSELIAAVAEQNAEIKRISEYSDSMALEAAEAAYKVLELRARTKEQVSVLAAQIGASCHEGISLIDRELNL